VSSIAAALASVGPIRGPTLRAESNLRALPIRGGIGCSIRMLDCAPVPNCPHELSPKHHTSCLVVTAHAWFAPVSTCVHEITATPLPQQSTTPLLACTAHECDDSRGDVGRHGQGEPGENFSPADYVS
jgi:hypothetical protein